MHPILVKIGPLTIHTYGFMMAVGVAFGFWFLFVQAKKSRLPASRLIDMAFYTIRKHIAQHEITESQLSDETFDYIFHGKRSLEQIARRMEIEKKVLKSMREEFLYWYPVDLRNSEKELLPNHLTFFLFQHVALFEKEFFPKAVAVNGMLMIEGKKMSKSKGNIVDPDDMIERYGADTTRLFSLFAAPPDKDLDWKEEGVEGSYRFPHRVWRLVYQFRGHLSESRYDMGKTGLPGNLWAMRQKVHKTIRKVTEDIERFHFNTAIAAVMELVNHIYQTKDDIEDTPLARSVWRETLESLVLLLSPFVPHLAEELWQALGKEGSLIRVPWPRYDQEVIVDDEILIVIQVNGRLRDRLLVPAFAEDEEIKDMALARPNVKRHIQGRQVKKTIVVPKLLVNIVCA